MGFYLLILFLFFFCFSYFLGAGPAAGGFARGFFIGGGAHCADGAGRAAKFGVFFVFFGLIFGPRARRGGRGPHSRPIFGPHVSRGAPQAAARPAAGPFFFNFFLAFSHFKVQLIARPIARLRPNLFLFLFPVSWCFVEGLRALKPSTKPPTNFNNSFTFFQPHVPDLILTILPSNRLQKLGSFIGPLFAFS